MDADDAAALFNADEWLEVLEAKSLDDAGKKESENGRVGSLSIDWVTQKEGVVALTVFVLRQRVYASDKLDGICAWAAGAISLGVWVERCVAEKGSSARSSLM